MIEKAGEILKIISAILLFLIVALLVAFPGETINFIRHLIITLVSFLEAKEGQGWFYFLPFFVIGLFFLSWIFLIVFGLVENKKAPLLFALTSLIIVGVSLSPYAGLSKEGVVLFNFWQEGEKLKIIPLEMIDRLVIEFNQKEEAKEKLPQCERHYSIYLKGEEKITLDQYSVEKNDLFTRIKLKEASITVVCQKNFWQCEGKDQQAENLCEEYF